MNDRKPPRRAPPAVEVIRRPAGSSAVSPRPPTPSPLPRPVTEARPSTPVPVRREVPRGARPPFRSSAPKEPPTPEQIQALAVKERVPARIAKGELDGKMKCRIWRKLHEEEARRFDQVYTLMSQHPGLSLPDGFGVIQSGLTVEEFLARKERTQKKAAIQQARGSVDNEALEGFVQGLIQSKTELAVVLGERALLDTLKGVEPIAFQLERSARLEKLQVVLLARRSDWETRSPLLEREPKLAQKPAPVARQPDKRPYSDPRPFLDFMGQTLQLTLRNGIQLKEHLLAAGRFDLLLGEPDHELFVPLHAVVRFEPSSQ